MDTSFHKTTTQQAEKRRLRTPVTQNGDCLHINNQQKTMFAIIINDVALLTLS